MSKDGMQRKLSYLFILNCTDAIEIVNIDDAPAI